MNQVEQIFVILLHNFCFVLLQGTPRFSVENFEKNKVIFERICEIVSKTHCSPSQLALAWVHHQGNDVAPIQGTTKVKNFEDNIGSLYVQLTSLEIDMMTWISHG